MTLAEQLAEWALRATDDELVAESCEIGAAAEAANVEIDRRAHERAAREIGGVPEGALPIAPLDLLRDALCLRMSLQQMYAAGDGGARQEPRYRRASALIERTDYLVGPDSPCTGNPRCGCDAHKQYEQWLADDARREQAMEAGERALEQQPGAIRRVM